MNYPIWDVPFGAGLLIAIVSILHVFVSHFAVGGGLFLVITERKGYRDHDEDLLGWLEAHTRFFVLLTVVFGAVSGVGIWFTIGLVHPSATSTLIHSYVWAWAIEWLFFFLEITAALLYFYGWKTLDRKTHLWIGWVYFATAFLSMVVINGIITFMLTPGGWVKTGRFWDGFLNPTYLPSLGLRFAFALALAGIYALLTGSREQDRLLRRRIVAWSSRWIVPAFAVLPVFAYWYIAELPPGVWAATQGRMPTATRYAAFIVIFSVVALLGSLWALVQPARFPFALSLVVFGAAFVTMWSFEFIRESIRKPYVIHGYMYSNSILARREPGDHGLNLEDIKKAGVLSSARWSRFRQIPPGKLIDAGQEVFRLDCQACHTTNHYRGLRGLIRARSWDRGDIYGRLGALDKMVNGAMPPFAGNESERQALATFLASLNPDIKPRRLSPDPLSSMSGSSVFTQHCGDCHAEAPDDRLFSRLSPLPEREIYDTIGRLPQLNPVMPAFTGSDQERRVLAAWIRTKGQ